MNRCLTSRSACLYTLLIVIAVAAVTSFAVEHTLAAPVETGNTHARSADTTALSSVADNPPISAKAQLDAGNVLADDVANDLVRVDISRIGDRNAAALALEVPTWDEAIAAGSAEIVVPRWQANSLLNSGFRLEVLGTAPDRLQAWPTCYDTLAEAYEWLTDYGDAHSDMVALHDIGDSYCKTQGGCRMPGGERLEGNDIWVAQVTNFASAAPKVGRMWIDGGLHAREIPGTPLMKAYIELLVGAYGSDPQLTYLLDHNEMYVGFNSNPDGRELVELGTKPPYDGAPWLWRKNGHEERRCTWPPTASEHLGVDLNRNHDFKWTSSGSSTNPCDELYRGRGAASEPEIQAYEDFIRSIFPDSRGPSDSAKADDDTLGILVNFHNATIPGTVLVPWGWTTRRPANDDELVAIADRYVRHNGYDRRYALYPVSGNTRDWGYGELGVPSYVLEMEGSTFFTPCPQLDHVIGDQLDAITTLWGLSDRPYVRVNGPEPRGQSVTGPVRAGETVTVTATLDESAAGGDDIGGGEVTIALVGGAQDAAGHPAPSAPHGDGLSMLPADGAFDGPYEEVSASIDTTGMTPGVYYIVVRGVDANGKWGPGVATFLDVLAPPTPSPTSTFTPSATPTPTATATATSTATPTATATPTPRSLHVPLVERSRH